MHASNGGVSYQTFPPHKMDYHKKMIVTPEQKIKIEEDDDEDLEALRLAALQSLRTKETINKKALQTTQPVVSHITQTSRFPYKSQRRGRGAFYHNRSHPRQAQNYNHPYQNGNVYYPSPRNPNLIAIVPVEEDTAPRQTEISCSVNIEKTDPCSETKSPEITKFHRFNDNGSGSEDEDMKDHKNTTEDAGKTESADTVNTETDKDVVGDGHEEKAEEEGDSQKNEENGQEDNDDDADILLMADLEEEDSLERLMDEMEKEMNVDKPSDQKQAKLNKKEYRESRKQNESLKNQEQKMKTDDTSSRKLANSSASLNTAVKSERRSISPHRVNTLVQKRRSLSPKMRSRKKSPRRSPRRSPPRQGKKPQRDSTRYKSPRKSPPRYRPRSRSPRLSPRSRSPRLSPRRSPNRSPIRRSPLRKLSPRGRSPRISPHTRSPKRLRSRTPPVMSRSKSPRPVRSPKALSRSRSPRLRSRSPRYSPVRRSRSKSPRGSPRRGTPPRRLSPRRSPPSRRLSPRLRSPVLSPRRTSPRGRSPKLSPRRVSPRLRSPRPVSPRRSPWSSPRNSPRVSPRRKRSPQWSPKEPSRKRANRSFSPDTNNFSARDSPPVVKGKSSPETSRQKVKQREDQSQRNTPVENTKEHVEITNDPILEARRKKFECTKPIDLVVANKKIKLSKKENVTKANSTEDLTSSNSKKSGKLMDDYDAQETDLCLDVSYEFEDLDDSMENTSPVGIPSTVSVEVEPTKVEKEKKKKRKRDKEIYQVGKLKGELPLSERIGKDKKAKKKKDVSETSSEDVEAIFEDLAVDEEGDLRTELSRRRAERLHRTVPLQSARLVQSAFKGVVNEVVKNNAKVNQRHMIKNDDKSNQKEIRRVTVLHRTVSDLHDSEDESAVDSKVPVRFRLGLNKQVQETRESKVSRKASKRQGRKG